ncbi:MAG: helix-turn-helix domain-containing protein [Vulcanimicrobiota bacterium]
MDNPYQFHTVKEIADILRVSDWSVYDAVRQGLLPSVRIGRKVRIEHAAFCAWVDQGGMTYEALEQQAS